MYINGKRFDNHSTDFEKEFYAYCGYDYVTGKKRMSMKREHQIGLTLHESLESKLPILFFWLWLFKTKCPYQKHEKIKNKS